MRLKGVPRVGVALVPFQVVDSQQQLKTQRMDSPNREHGPSTWIGVRDLVTWEKQELSFNTVTKASIQQASWKHLPLSSSNLCWTLASLRCTGRGGREGVQMRAMIMGTWKSARDSPHLVPSRVLRLQHWIPLPLLNILLNPASMSSRKSALLPG